MRGAGLEQRRQRGCARLGGAPYPASQRAARVWRAGGVDVDGGAVEHGGWVQREAEERDGEVK